MAREEMRERLVQRADLVAEQEELEVALEDVEAALTGKIKGFEQLKGEFARFTLQRRMLFERIRLSTEQLTGDSTSFVNSPKHRTAEGRDFTLIVDTSQEYQRMANEFGTYLEKMLAEMEADDEDTFELFGDYLDMQERIRHLDQKIGKNVLDVEQIIKPNLLLDEEKIVEYRAAIAEKNTVLLAMVDKEEEFSEEFDRMLIGPGSGSEGVRDLMAEREQLHTDLETFKKQKEAVLKRKACLKDEKARLLERLKIIEIWTTVDQKYKVIDELERDIEKHQIEKLALESEIVGTTYQKSDQLMERLDEDNQRRRRNRSRIFDHSKNSYSRELSEQVESDGPFKRYLESSKRVKRDSETTMQEKGTLSDNRSAKDPSVRTVQSTLLLLNSRVPNAEYQKQKKTVSRILSPQMENPDDNLAVGKGQRGLSSSKVGNHEKSKQFFESVRKQKQNGSHKKGGNNFVASKSPELYSVKKRERLEQRAVDEYTFQNNQDKNRGQERLNDRGSRDNSLLQMKKSNTSFNERIGAGKATKDPNYTDLFERKKVYEEYVIETRGKSQQLKRDDGRGLEIKTSKKVVPFAEDFQEDREQPINVSQFNQYLSSKEASGGKRKNIQSLLDQVKAMKDSRVRTKTEPDVTTLHEMPLINSESKDSVNQTTESSAKTANKSMVTRIPKRSIDSMDRDKQQKTVQKNSFSKPKKLTLDQIKQIDLKRVFPVYKGTDGASKDKFPTFNPFHSNTITPEMCGYELYDAFFERGFFALLVYLQFTKPSHKKAKEEPFKFDILDILKIFVSPTTAEFLNKKSKSKPF
jgi:hypothetical protein